MNKLVTAFIITACSMSVLCVFLRAQVTDLEKRNSVFEDQISEYQNQTTQLKDQIMELENQIDNLRDEYQNQIDELENQIEDLEEQIFQKKLPAARKVKIIAVKFGKDNYNTMWISARDIHVTVKNYGDTDVDGLTVSTGDSTAGVGYIQAGETKSVTVVHYAGLGYGDGASSVTLQLNGVSLDRHGI